MDFKFIYSNLCSEVAQGCSKIPQAWGRFLYDASSEININYIKM